MEKFCQCCGSQLSEKYLENEGMIPYCDTCGQFRFPMYNVAVSIITINKENEKILLIQQYGRKKNILVAGYVNKGEAIEHAVARELKEEMGLTANEIIFNRSKFFEPSNTLMCNFTAFVENDQQLKTNEEIDSYQWFTKNQAREEIFPNSLASEFLNAYLDSLERRDL